MRRSTQGRAYTAEDTDRLLHEMESSERSNADTVRLLSLTKKTWILLDDINRLICSETTKFILKHKPIFDKEKLALIEIQY